MGYMEDIFGQLDHKDRLHHAYLVVSNVEAVVSELEKALTRVDIPLENNPDYINWEGDLFGIGEARNLKARQSMTSLSGKKIFVICTRGLTLEAQNALLKTFEEPTPGTHFFLIVPFEDIILPTLRSRMVKIRDTRLQEENLYKNFLKLSAADRLNLITKVIENKNYSEAIIFLNAIEEQIKKVVKNIPDQKTIDAISCTMSEIETARMRLLAKQGSIKLWLEMICLTAPTL
tara:strand:- start:162 stop:857 length:696 start_codon:yes stop_codon:yes gene_type:complete